MKTDAPVIIGKYQDGEPAAVDVPALIGSHCCVVANSGGGKSGLLRRLLEVTHGQVQHIVLDAEDEFFTLRQKFAYVIAGGDGGDVPAQIENAGSLALAALQHRFSLIVQLNDLPDRAAFVGAFLAALVNAPKDLWHPVLVVVDEAQRFAPEGSSVDSSAGVRDLLERGRKRGFTALLASNRLAVIDKSVTGNVNNWLLGRVGQSRDRLAVANALGFSPASAEARGLQGLPPRTFWSFGPALSQVPTQFRVADVETTIIRSGQSGIATPPAPEALGKILRELVRAAATEPPAAGTTAPTPAVDRAIRAELDWYYDVLKTLKAEVPLALERLHRADEARVSALAHLEVVLDAICPVELPPSEDAAPPSLPAPDKAAGSANHNLEGLSGPEAKIIVALGFWKSTGEASPRREQVAGVAGYSPNTGNFRAVVGRVVAAGLVGIPQAGRLSLAAGTPFVALSKAQAAGMLCSRLSGPEQKLVNAALATPRAISRSDLAAATGYSANTGNFRALVGALCTLDVLIKPRDGHVALSEWARKILS